MKRMVGIFTAVALTVNSVSVFAVKNGADIEPGTPELPAGAAVQSYDVLETGSFERISDGTNAVMGIADEIKPFYTYSNQFYDEQYGEYGCGWAYYDAAERKNGKERQKFYEDLLSACQNFASNYADLGYTGYIFDKGEVGKYYQIPGMNSSYALTGADAAETYFVFKYDHPEYYWLDTHVDFLSNGKGLLPVVEISEEFLAGEYRSEIDTRMQESIDWYLNYIDFDDENYNDYSKIRLIHDLLCETTDYGWEDKENDIPLDTVIAHSIVGMFDWDRSTDVVCEGYAKSFQLLLNVLGIENVYVVGLGDGGGHAWNIAAIDGEYYNFDVTWDDQSNADGSQRTILSFFAKNDTDFSDLGEHQAFTSQQQEASFLYDLPEICGESLNLSEFSDDTIALVRYPEDKDPIEMTMPKPTAAPVPIENEVEIKAAELVKKIPELSYYSDLGDLYKIEFEIKKGRQAAEYNRDFYAEYDGERLEDLYYEVVKNGIMLKGERIDYSKLIFKAARGCMVTAKPSLF